MYCVNGKPRSSLLIESTDSMIYIFIYIYIYIYTYLYIYIFIYIFQAVRRARAVNALRANVGPAGSGSTVNIIALKTATLVLSCS